MIFAELNASSYDHSSHFYNAEFEDILSKIVACYYLMLSDNLMHINDENSIRDKLYLNYLNNDKVRRIVGLLSYKFDRETIEDFSPGRTDIRVISINTFLTTSDYYIIECKRIDSKNPSGLSGLNAEYIKNGICRFVTKAYSSYYFTNAMIGFIVQPININQNVDAINHLLFKSFPQSQTIQKLIFIKIIENFSFSFCSIHKSDDKNIFLYHLMFDLSNHIK